MTEGRFADLRKRIFTVCHAKVRLIVRLCEVKSIGLLDVDGRGLVGRISEIVEVEGLRLSGRIGARCNDLGLLFKCVDVGLEWVSDQDWIIAEELIEGFIVLLDLLDGLLDDSILAVRAYHRLRLRRLVVDR